MLLEAQHSVDIFVQGIGSEPDVDETTRMHYMLVLLRGAAEELKKLGRRGVIIKKSMPEARRQRE